MDKKLVAAAGATVTSAAFQLSTVIWPQWIKDHVYLVVGLWALSAALWLWWLVNWLISKAPKSEPAKVVNRGNVVGGDNSGRMIVAEHYHEASFQPIQIPPNIEPPNFPVYEVYVPPPPVAHLEFAIRAMDIAYRPELGAWTE